MLNSNSKSGGLAYSEKSKINHDNSKARDALNDGFEDEDLNNDEGVDADVSTADQFMPTGKKSPDNKKNDKEKDVPNVKPEKYNDLASSGT